jgi:hypothetical protein
MAQKALRHRRRARPGERRADDAGDRAAARPGRRRAVPQRRRAHRVVIGKDTRRSGYMIENALTGGFTSVGMNVFLLGPVPTPAVGMLTRSMRADIGVMISASHNPHHDNGIKFFGPDGYKLSDATEEAIEARLAGGRIELAEPARIGRAQRIEDGRGRYMEFAKTTFPAGRRLEGLKWWSTAPTGRPTARRRRCSGSSAPRWFRSGSIPTASTSTTAAARPGRSGRRRRCSRAGRTSGSASTATPTG